MKGSANLMKVAFDLIKESKIQEFTKLICEQILAGVISIDSYLNAPSIIDKLSNESNNTQYKEFVLLNAANEKTQNFLKNFDATKDLSENFTAIFNRLEISPHFVQDLAMKILCNNCLYTHQFHIIAPGLGKTKLILAHAINLAALGHSIFILNTNETLLKRDYEQAFDVLGQLEISNSYDIRHKSIITYTTLASFIDFAKQINYKYHIILDEYQNVFFNDTIMKAFLPFQNAQSFSGFSGSPHNNEQKRLIQTCFNKQTLVVQLSSNSIHEQQDTFICKTQTQHIQILADYAQKFRKSTPQVFILDKDTASKLTRGNKKQHFVNLINQSADIVNNTLDQLFNQRNEDKEYGTYIIDEEMGTGTDFKTSDAIEQNGGLVLIFGIKPVSSSTFEQLSCRVGRIFNKGRRYYVIHDREFKGTNENYLRMTLKEIIKTEKQQAYDLLRQLTAHNAEQNAISNNKTDQNIAKEDIDSESNLNKISIDVVKGEENIKQAKHTNKVSKCDEEKLKDNVKQNLMFENTNVPLINMIKDASFKLATHLHDENIQQKVNDKCTADTIMNKVNNGGAAKVENQNQKKSSSKEEIKNDGYKLPPLQNTKCNKQQSILIQVQPSERTQDTHAKEGIEDQIGKDLPTYKGQNNQKDIVNDESKVQNNEVADIQMADATNEVQKEELDAKLPIKVTENDQIEQEAKVLPLKGNMLRKRCSTNKSTKELEEQIKGEVAPQRTKRQVALSVTKTTKSNKLQPGVLGSIDDGYFANYSKAAIHKEMLDDEVRCAKYKEAIEKIVKDKTVLDVGCGTGILSAYAVIAGGLNVTAVDKADVKPFMTGILEKYQAVEKVTFINQKIEHLVLENCLPKFDVIISEWMGYFLLFENMIHSVLTARQNFLKPDGIMIPSQANMYLAVADIDCKQFKEVEDIHIAGKCKQAFIQCCPKDFLLQSGYANIQKIDFTNKKQENPLAKAGFISKFKMEIAKAGTVTAFVGWFDVTLCQGVILSTSPQEPDTHWKQTIFFLKKPIKVQIGQNIEGSIYLRGHNQRSMLADISYKISDENKRVYTDYFTFD